MNFLSIPVQLLFLRNVNLKQAWIWNEHAIAIYSPNLVSICFVTESRFYSKNLMFFQISELLRSDETEKLLILNDSINKSFTHLWNKTSIHFFWQLDTSKVLFLFAAELLFRKFQVNVCLSKSNCIWHDTY